MLAFNVSTGVAPNLLPNFFNAAGVITSVIANNNPNLDFSKFAVGATTNFTFTATSFSGGERVSPPFSPRRVKSPWVTVPSLRVPYPSQPRWPCWASA
jgi:hypothetical protein